MSHSIIRGFHRLRIAPTTISFGVGGLLLILCLWWLATAWASVTVTDARVAADIVTIRSQVHGVVTLVRVREGEQYDAGKLMVQLDDRVARSETAEREAKLQRLESSWNQMQMVKQSAADTASVSESDASLGLLAARFAAQAAKVRVEQSRSILGRSSRLAADGLVSTMSVDHDRDSYVLARLNAREAIAAETRKANDLRGARLGRNHVLEAQLGAQAAAGAVLEATAAVEVARLIWSRYRVRAPQPGIIGKTFVRAGDSVVEGQRLVLLYDPRTIRVEARVSERDLVHFPMGKRVWVTVDANGDRKFPGVITSIGALTQSATSEWPQQPEQGNFVRVAQKVPIQIAVVVSGQRLIPGTLARVKTDRR